MRSWFRSLKARSRRNWSELDKTCQDLAKQDHDTTVIAEKLYTSTSKYIFQEFRMSFMKEIWDDVSSSRQLSAVDMHLLLHLPHRRAHPHCIRTLPTSIFPTHPSIFPIFPIFNCYPYPDLKQCVPPRNAHEHIGSCLIIGSKPFSSFKAKSLFPLSCS